MKNKNKKILFSMIIIFFSLFLSFASQTKAASISGYADEGTAFYAFKDQQTGTVPVYRLYSESLGDSLYTISETEKNNAVKNFKYIYKEVAFYAYATQQTDVAPIYRFYNKSTSDHFYQSSGIVPSGHFSEGIAFYAYATQQAGTVPIYRFYNSKTGDHLYTASEEEKTALLGEKENLGPEISVGLWSYTQKDLKKNPFKISANKDYVIKDKDGNKLAEVSKDKTTNVKSNGGKGLIIYGSISSKETTTEVRFEAKDGNNADLVFNANRPSSSYDRYRGKIKLKYNDSDKNIWVINILPMEQYTWGMGETTGTGPLEHTKVMTTIFRTYGYWYKEYATKYLKYGFIIRSDSGSQIYGGFDWETKYPNIKKAADETRGIIAKYKDEIALTPYSSWSDGRTRSFEERWGSDDYPWCKSVKDPYGKHPTLSTKKLEKAGNHMVGLIANGSVKLAGDSYKKKYDWIMKYYFTDISLKKMY